MTRPTATCELYVNDTRVPDTGQQLIAAEPTVLDGLSLTWGRDGQNEQPGPATCSFTILDRYAESDFLDRLHVGSPVALWAEGSFTQDQTYLETVDDPTFQSYPLGDAGRIFAQGNTGVLAPVRTISDQGSHGHVADTLLGSLSPQTGALRQTLIFPPRPFSPSGELPDAWDDIPRAQKGDTDLWRYRCTFRAPKDTTIKIYPTGFITPYAASRATVYATTFTATGDWQNYEVLSKPVVHSTGSGDWQGLSLTLEDDPGTLWWLTAVGAWSDQDARTWSDVENQPRFLVDDVSVSQPGGAVTSRRVLTFSGAVTDVVATPYGNGDTLNLAVTAADLGSDLGNRVIGDVPWPVQTLATRADRIAQLAGITTSPRVRIDTPLGDLQVSYRDVDAQPSYALLQDLAQTGGGVLWAATHAVTGPFLWIENPADRASLRELTLSGSLITITGASDGVTIISACDLLEDPISWRQDTADVSTVVAVTWLEQGTDDDGKPTTTERTETVSDPTAVTTYGTRRLSISTELVNQSDAISIANRALATARAVPWRIEGLTFDTDSTFAELDTVDDASREIALLNLLDGTTRMGLAVTLVDMPDYAPRGSISDVYVEGGRYAFEGGAWTLALNATPSGGQGTSATWGEIDPAWLWAQWSPTLTWQDLYGVAA